MPVAAEETNGQGVGHVPCSCHKQSRSARSTDPSPGHSHGNKTQERDVANAAEAPVGRPFLVVSGLVAVSASSHLCL